MTELTEEAIRKLDEVFEARQVLLAKYGSLGVQISAAEIIASDDVRNSLDALHSAARDLAFCLNNLMLEPVTDERQQALDESRGSFHSALVQFREDARTDLAAR